MTKNSILFATAALMIVVAFMGNAAAIAEPVFGYVNTTAAGGDIAMLWVENDRTSNPDRNASVPVAYLSTADSYYFQDIEPLLLAHGKNPGDPFNVTVAILCSGADGNGNPYSNTYHNDTGVTAMDNCGIAGPTYMPMMNLTPCPTETRPDIVVSDVFPQFIFANLTNVMSVNVTNQGNASSGDCNVSLTIPGYPTLTGNVSPLGAGNSMVVEVGNWKPTSVVNTSMTAFADCDDDVNPEWDEGNNNLTVTRNTTGDCYADDMLPDTCYGYRGQNPMTNSVGTGEVIYSVGDYKYKYNTTVNFNIGASGDENQVDGLTADIPGGATIKNATLYVYYCWRQIDNSPNPGNDPRLDYEMSFDGFDLTCNEYYTDEKGFGTGTKYQYGTLVYDVTANVTGDGTYQAVRSNSTTSSEPKGYVSGMALMIIHDCSSSTYRIAHGYDRVATWYKTQYKVLPEDATTTATLTDANTALMVSTNLFTVTLDAVAPGNESEQFNTRAWDVGAWDCVNGASPCGYLYPIGINRGAVNKSNLTASGINETVTFQERTNNGFAPVFACLTTREKKSVATAVPGQGDANFSVDKGCVNDLTALTKGDVCGGTTTCPTCYNDSGATFPYGLFKFNITGLEPGATVDVIIELPSGPPPTNYTKINTTAGNCTWYDMGSNFSYNDNTHVVTLNLTDGGLGDNDGVADGQITDPGGPSTSAAVQVSIDPCPAFVCAGPGCNTTVNITLSNIVDYGSGTIILCYDNTVVNLVDVGKGDSMDVTHNSFSCGSGVCERISASNTDGLSGDVVFATVTFEPAAGVTSGCSDLNLTVTTLYDRNYTALQTVVVNCTCLSGGLHITEADPPVVTACDASPPVILNDTTQMRGRKLGTNVTNLSVNVADATSVEAVYVNLTPILGNPVVNNMVQMIGPNGTSSGVWHWGTNASFSNLTPYCLNVMAVDFHGNWENNSCITLEVQRRGDVAGSDADNKVLGLDYYRIARWTVGLDSEPNTLRGNVVPAESWNGIDMADALYIAMYVVHGPPMDTYPAP